MGAVNSELVRVDDSAVLLFPSMEVEFSNGISKPLQGL